MSMYSWDPVNVIAGESVGVCLKPTAKTDSNASCWEWKMDQEGVFGDSPQSFLVKMQDIDTGSGLD